jgi:hypothetical protein
MRNGWRRFTRKIALKRTRQRLLRDVTRHQLQKEAIAEGEELWRRMPVGQKITLLLLFSRELRTSLNAIVGDCQPSRISVPREHGRLPYSPFGNIFVPFPAIETPIICAKSSPTVW